MELNYIIYIALFCAVIYFLFLKSTNESFTNTENELAHKIQTYLKTPKKNYIDYAKILNDNKNTSINLTKIATYNSLISKGNNISIDQILSQF